MADWKGTKVTVRVDALKPDAVGRMMVFVTLVALDTDTMAHLFDQYPPDAYTYRIEPARDPLHG